MARKLLAAFKSSLIELAKEQLSRIDESKRKFKTAKEK